MQTNRTPEDHIGKVPKPDALGIVLIFNIHGQRYALPLNSMDRVTRAVAITRVPDSPADVLGVINMHGAVLPVLNLRRRLGFPNREMALSDRLIVTRVSWGRLVMVVDEVEGLHEITISKAAEKHTVVSGIGVIGGVTVLQDDIVLICNVERFLSGAGLEWAAGVIGGSAG